MYSPSSVISKKSFNPYKSITGSITNLEAPFSSSTVRGTPASTKSLMNHKIDFNYSKSIAKMSSNKSKILLKINQLSKKLEQTLFSLLFLCSLN